MLVPLDYKRQRGGGGGQKMKYPVLEYTYTLRNRNKYCYKLILLERNLLKHHPKRTQQVTILPVTQALNNPRDKKNRHYTTNKGATREILNLINMD